MGLSTINIFIIRRYIYTARRLLKENGRRQAEKNAQTFSAGIYSVLSPLTCHVILHTHVLRMRT